MAENEKKDGMSIEDIINEYTPKAASEKSEISSETAEEIIEQVTKSVLAEPEETPEPEQTEDVQKAEEIQEISEEPVMQKADESAASEIPDISFGGSMPVPQFLDYDDEDSGYEYSSTSERRGAADFADNEDWLNAEDEDEEADIDDEEEPVPEENEDEETAEEYLQAEQSQNANNRGAAFTMRTDEVNDSTKAPTRQTEYTSREDSEVIYNQILKLKNTLTVRAAVTLFAAVFSLFVTIANDMRLPLAPVFDRTINPSAYVFTNTILGIVVIGFSYAIVTNGIKRIFKGRPDSDSVAAINILITVLAGIATLFDPESVKASFYHVYTSVAITGMLFNTLGKLSIVLRTKRNFEFVSEARSFSAVQLVDDDQTVTYLTNGSAGSRKELAVMRKTNFIKDFMKNSYSSDLADSYAERTTPLIIAVSIVIGVLSVIFEKDSSGTAEKLFVFMASMSGTLALCSSFALALLVNIPLSKASKKLINSSGVLLGYSSVEEFAEVNSVLIDAGHIFPTGTVDIVNMKICGSSLIDECIVYSASMAAAGRSITQPAFYKMLRGDLGMLKEVQGCTAEKNLGVTGWIENKRVLLGGRKLMEKHGIDGLPTPSAEESFAGNNCVMYLAVSGRVSVMFAVSLSVGAAAERWIQELEDESVEIHVRCSDGFVTRELLANMFDISASSIRLLPSNCDDDCARVTEPVGAVSSSMFCSGHLPTFAMLLIAAKKVKHAANFGNAVQYGAMLLGIVISIIMMLTGSFEQITPTITLIYNLAFLALIRLLQGMKKF